MQTPKRALVALVLAGTLIPATSAARDAAPRQAPAHHRRGCQRLFSVQMGERAANAIYRGARTVTPRNLRLLGYLERCQRNPRAQGFVRSYDRRRGAEHAARRYVAAHPWNGPVVASWFDDSGGTACGIHATYGFATLLNIPCGATITMRGPGGTITATREDSGPYISGRTFDLNPALRDALGCGGLCDVYWR